MSSAPAKDLWAHSERVAERALRAGALQPIETRVTEHHDGGLLFHLHVIAQLPQKRAAQAACESPHNPFLPHDPRLLVGEVGADHLLLLNKYPVLRRHLLLISRAFVPQTRALALADFAASLDLLRRAPGLCFYNAGAQAGASQPHRHVQLVDDRDPGTGQRWPLCERLTRLHAVAPVALPELPFAHAALSFGGSDERRAANMHAAYLRLLDVCGVHRDARNTTSAYNLLFIDGALLLVPRRHEHAAGLSINALGFAGQLLAASDDEAQAFWGFGLAAALREVAGPPLDLPAAGDAEGKAE